VHDYSPGELISGIKDNCSLIYYNKFPNEEQAFDSELEEELNL